MKGYKEDINYLINKIEEIHPNPYLYYKKESFYKDLKELSNSRLSLDEFKYEIRRWKKDGTAGKGVTFTENQLKEFIKIIKEFIITNNVV